VSVNEPISAPSFANKFMEYLFPAVQFVTITISAESPARIVIGLPSKVLV